ncbi:hypothetical protein L3N51_00077 [Metallosphaera sp. J1]|nr:hypothetical protein [Metallosphaera javensis (ex Hofmann et al. 2022)]MCG3107810.1 hypothetical protein [Metallosphaera javensis (ex Hofmann et al. 2022)]
MVKIRVVRGKDIVEAFEEFDREGPRMPGWAEWKAADETEDGQGKGRSRR